WALQRIPWTDVLSSFASAAVCGGGGWLRPSTARTGGRGGMLERRSRMNRTGTMQRTRRALAVAAAAAVGSAVALPAAPAAIYTYTPTEATNTSATADNWSAG